MHDTIYLAATRCVCVCIHTYTHARARTHNKQKTRKETNNMSTKNEEKNFVLPSTIH